MKKIYLVFLIFSMLSCSDDFLELAPESEANADNFYQNEDDFNTALVGVYANLQSQVSDVYFEMTGYRSDNMQLDAPTAGTQDRYNIDVFQETSANGIILDAWALLYNGIAQSNEIISRIDGADFSENLKNQLEGEARFLRAMNYFNLVRFWGNVPLVLNPVSPNEALSIGRNDESEVYLAIEEDLIFASENLPESFTGDDFGRATAGAANAMLGKVYLTEEKYSEAKTVLEKVINGGQYLLLDSIQDVFDVNNKGNEEVIFAIRYNKEVIDEGHGTWFTVPDPTTSSVVSASLVNSYADNDLRKNLIEFTQSGSAFILNKFYDELSETTNTTGNDYIVLRYADVLLMHAEVLNELGYESDGEAFERLNEVRVRAGLVMVSGAEISDQAAFRAFVLNERRLELPLEGERWFDLIRTKTAVEAIEEVGVSIQKYQFLYPVPQTEIEKINNTDLFSQNEGYD